MKTQVSDEVRAPRPSSPIQRSRFAAEALDAEFTRDPAFAEEIRSLWQQVNHGNSFTGTAKNVLQIQENNGPITFN